MSSPERRLTPERRRALTREHLLVAAAVVFAERGYARASVDEIAEAAGFTKGAVYSNFGSKEELFLALVRERQEVMLGEFFDPPSSIVDVYQRLAPSPEEWKLWTEFSLYALRKPELAQLLRNDGNAAFAELVARLEERLRTLPGKSPLSAPQLAHLYTAIFDGLNQRRAIDPDSVDDELFATLVQFVEDALIALASR